VKADSNIRVPGGYVVHAMITAMLGLVPSPNNFSWQRIQLGKFYSQIVSSDQKYASAFRGEYHARGWDQDTTQKLAGISNHCPRRCILWA
jgi:hypothetical protein